MRRVFVLGMCSVFLLILLSFTANPVSLNTAQVCKGIEVGDGIIDPDQITLSTSMSCVGESYQFTTEDDGAFLLIHLNNLIEGDEVKIEIYKPDGSVLDSDEGTLPGNMSSAYLSFIIPIAGQNMMLGMYNATLFYEGKILVSKTFTISAPDYSCVNNGMFCCPPDKRCLNKPDSKYVCTSGSCCASALSCVQQVSGELTVRIVTDCVAEGLEECDRVIGNVYDYSIHGALENPQTIEFFYRDIDVDCFNKNNVVIAAYDEMNSTNGTSAWKFYESTTTKLAGNYYSITAQIDYVGYMAVVKSPRCVPIDCFIPGFNTVPFDGMVIVGNPITLSVCQITKFCNALSDGVCDRKCTQNLDPDCGGMTCTSQMNDCCNPEKDDICDLDCALVMDPDCADESYLGGLCYPSNPQKRGFAQCDVHCTGADPTCSLPGCDPSPDGTCNPNCPRFSNGVGYLDVDCCVLYGVSVTSERGDCCNRDNDDVCDPDCIPGLDPDCNKKITCNPNGVKESFEQCDGTDFGAYSGCASYLGTGYEGNLTCTSSCKIDTSSCQYSYTPPEGGGW